MNARFRLLLAPAFGLAMGLSFAFGWLLLDRAMTSRALAACLTIAVAACISAGVALLANDILARRPWSARFAAALLVLIGGTGLLTAAAMGAETAWTTHPMLELSPKLMLIILALSSAGALYSFLTIAGFLILPLGVPALILAAALIATRPH